MRSYRVTNDPDAPHMEIGLYRGDTLTHTLFIAQNPFTGSYRVCKDAHKNVVSAHNDLLSAYNAMLDLAKSY